MIAGSKILSMGHYQPARVLTNEDLARVVERLRVCVEREVR